MATVTINGFEYTTYANVTQADEYLLASLSYETWNALSADNKARNLVEATRVLDRQKWKAGYTTFDQREPIKGIVDASIELAAMLASGETDFISSSSTTSTTKRLKAGSAEIEYFGPNKRSATRFQTNIMELIGAYLISTGFGSFGGAFVSGVDGKSTSGRNYGYVTGI